MSESLKTQWYNFLVKEYGENVEVFDLPFVKKDLETAAVIMASFGLKVEREVKGVFNVDGPCPECGYHTLFGYSFFNQNGAHQHTHYVCTYWPSDGIRFTERCGWHGWSVPREPTETYRIVTVFDGLELYSEDIETSEDYEVIAQKYANLPGIVRIEQYVESTDDWETV